MIETRALGADIVDGIEFHLQRCIDTGVAIFAITDGRYWHLYPISEGVTPGKPTTVCDLFIGKPSDVEAMTMLECKTPAFVHNPSK